MDMKITELTYNRKKAVHYDEYTSSLSYSGPKNVVTKWIYYYQQEHYEQDKNGGKSTHKSAIVHKLFDAGCGTGLVGQEFINIVDSSTLHNVKLFGGDLSKEMLDIAASKKIYNDLKIIDLYHTLPYPNEYFDSILCAGVFLQGLCGPSCLTNLVKILKKGCYLIATVRSAYYEETKKEWEKEIKKCHCELLEVSPITYRIDINGVVLVIKKCLSE